MIPPRCAACHRSGAWLCQSCRDQIAYISVRDNVGPYTGFHSPSADSAGIQEIRSVAYHEGVLRKAIHQFKYGGVRALSGPLGDILFVFWQAHPLPADVLVPVPLHARRLRERGYNQSRLLALALAESASLSVDDVTLKRDRHTLPQVGLDVEQRRENVKDAFACGSDALAGRRVVLIDDVHTTGATLGACAVAMLERGAWTVSALTLARAKR